VPAAGRGAGRAALGGQESLAGSRMLAVICGSPFKFPGWPPRHNPSIPAAASMAPPASMAAAGGPERPAAAVAYGADRVPIVTRRLYS
jgi:hypothetical protein